jgi:hypothetical protein
VFALHYFYIIIVYFVKHLLTNAFHQTDSIVSAKLLLSHQTPTSTDDAGFECSLYTIFYIIIVYFVKHLLTNAFHQTDSIVKCKAAALIRLPVAPTTRGSSARFALFLCNYCLFLKHLLTSAFHQTNSIGKCNCAKQLLSHQTPTSTDDAGFECSLYTIFV